MIIIMIIIIIIIIIIVPKTIFKIDNYFLLTTSKFDDIIPATKF